MSIALKATGGTNNPPTVSISSPANGATFTAPASVTINATAADSDGTISSVAFYQGSTLLGTDTSSPYSYTWSNVAAGSYSLTARATDNGGAVTTSTAVGITVSGGGGSNIIQNPGFETGTTASWGGSWGNYSVVTTAPRTGTYCAQVNSGGMVQIATVQPNTTYTLSGYVKSGTGTITYLGVKNYGGNEISQGTTATTWTPASVQFTTGASNTTAEIYIWSQGQGYGDDTSCVAN
jgi:hypothetical protein